MIQVILLIVTATPLVRGDSVLMLRRLESTHARVPRWPTNGNEGIETPHCHGHMYHGQHVAVFVSKLSLLYVSSGRVRLFAPMFRCPLWQLVTLSPRSFLAICQPSLELSH